MNEITTQSPAATELQANELQLNLIDSFLNYIHKGKKTARSYLTNLRQFAAYLLYNDIRRPDRSDVMAYRDYLSEEHKAIILCGNSWDYRRDKNGNEIILKCKQATVRAYMQSVKQFFKWTAHKDLYPNIAEDVETTKEKYHKADHHKKEALTVKDVQNIEQSIIETAGAKMDQAAASDKDRAGRIERATEQGKRLFAMYLLAVNAGLRTVELSRAKVKDIETKEGQAFIYIWGKGHAEPDQKKALAPEVKAAIDDYLNARGDSWTSSSPLFVSTGNRSRGKSIAPTTISTMLKRAMQAAGYDSERLTAHSLRHTTGTAVMELTNDNIYITQQYMRHENPKTTEIYTHRKKEKQDIELAKKLYKKYHSETDPEQQQGPEEMGAAERLQAIITKLTPTQLQQLTGIAAAMA